MTEETAAIAPVEGITDSSDDMDAEYSAAFAKATGGEPVEEEVTETEGEAVEAAEEAPEATKEPVVASPPPTELPSGVKSVWGDIPQAARDAIIESQRDLSDKLANQGRFVQALNPIKDVLTKAAQEIPNLMNMKPEQVASEIMVLAKISKELEERPLETLMGIVQKRGLGAQMAAALSGQAVTPDTKYVSELQNEVRTLQRKLEQVSDPNYFRSQVSQITAETQAESLVTKFASTVDHWAELEAHIPTYIPIVRDELGQNASAEDVLKAAYELAVQRRMPETKAKAPPVDEAKVVNDPKKTEAAIKAKSVNVSSTTVGKQREMTEDEILSSAYRRAVAR